MDIQKISYQYVEPKPQYVPETQGTTFELNPKWYKYFNAIFDKNYFTEDELEFLMALKEDLEQELQETNDSIKKLTKTR